MSILAHCSCSRVPHPLACSQVAWPTTGHHRGFRYSRSTSKRSIHNNPFALYTDRVNSYIPNRPGIVVDLFSLPARPDLSDNPVMTYNGFATVEG